MIIFQFIHRSHSYLAIFGKKLFFFDWHDASGPNANLSQLIEMCAFYTSTSSWTPYTEIYVHFHNMRTYIEHWTVGRNNGNDYRIKIKINEITSFFFFDDKLNFYHSFIIHGEITIEFNKNQLLIDQIISILSDTSKKYKSANNK